MSHLKNHRRAGLGVWHPATKYKKTSKTWGPPATPQSHCCGRRAMTSLSKFNYIILRGPHQPTCVLTFYLIHMLTFFLTFYLLSGILSDLCSDMFPHWIRNSIWQCILHFGWNIYIYTFILHFIGIGILSNISSGSLSRILSGVPHFFDMSSRILSGI